MKKRYLILIILMLVIGFASVSTIIYINGKTNIGANLEDYSIYFSEAYIDDIERLDVISEDKQKITINTKVLKDIGDSEKLEYDVTNASKQYDAKVSITCEPTENEYYEMEHVFENEIIKARTYETGYITIKLKKVSVEEQDLEFTCRLKVEALEKTEANTSHVKKRCKLEEGKVWTFDYKGSQQSFEVPCDGTYKLEVWGAQGGTANLNGYVATGGYGGYSTGEIKLSYDDVLYVAVGGIGVSNSTYTVRTPAGGYNGGAYGGRAPNDTSKNICVTGGGGATHIATKSGLLSTLNTSRDSILIVAGGGAGGYIFSSQNFSTNGGHGGGYLGTNSCNEVQASQTTGYAFGAAGRIDNTTNRSGGGGGFYGGISCWQWGPGGGSGYIGNPLLTNKGMWCYGCTASTVESTKTTSTNCTIATPTANCSKQGNGYAKITLVSSD